MTFPQEFQQGFPQEFVQGGGQDQFQRLALGYARRRSHLVAALLGGLCVMGSGLAWALTALALGLEPGSGLVMLGVGAGMAALGWLATAGLRFTRSAPKPLDNAKDMESNTRINVISLWIVLALIAAGCLALFLFSPRGREADAMVLLPSFIAFPAVLLAGTVHIRSMVLRREALFAAWLARAKKQF